MVQSMADKSAFIGDMLNPTNIIGIAEIIGPIIGTISRIPASTANGTAYLTWIISNPIQVNVPTIKPNKS